MFKRLLPFSFDEESSTFLLFAVMMFFIFLGDGIMSYYAPVIMDEILGSATKMGFIMSISSVIGLITDFLFSRYFPNKKGFFFLRILLFMVFLFPLSFFFSPNSYTFIFAMMWWGVSYEAMIFTTFHGVHEHVSRAKHAWAWGILTIFRNISLALGAMIASISYDTSSTLPLFIVIMLNAIGVFIFFIRLIVKKKKDRLNIFDTPVQIETVRKRSWADQVQIWMTLDKKIWPLLLFMLIIYLCDSAVYTIGPLLGEKMSEIHPWGGVFVSMYSLPGIFLGFAVARLAQPFGKKKLAFASGIFAGLGFLLIGVFSQASVLLSLMFFSACWFALLHPSMTAVFEDLISRAEAVSNDLISNTSVTSSLAYIVGPILNGYLAESYGERAVFGLWGGFLLVISAVLFVVFPRKVRLPQTELAEIME